MVSGEKQSVADRGVTLAPACRCYEGLLARGSAARVYRLPSASYLMQMPWRLPSASANARFAAARLSPVMPAAMGWGGVFTVSRPR